MSPKKYTFESFQSIQRELPKEKPVHGEYHQRAEQESSRRKENPSPKLSIERSGRPKLMIAATQKIAVLTHHSFTV